MAAPLPTTGLVYDDLAAFPDDGLRRELIDGELVVTPAPRDYHQRVVVRIAAALLDYERRHGGVVLPAPSDVRFADDTVLEPDVLFVTAGHRDRVGERYTTGPPDLVVEVSSPSTRRLELVRKREVYERFAVPEYWYVDLDVERVEVYRLRDGRYGAPVVHYAGETVASAVVEGFAMAVSEILGPWD
ncbi:MAG TPA: Uma2 family endonuclease [Egibacteraceae bacterium]|nr:Uma2 family endonuclease [Egibacteraceae bacterium]